MKHTFEIRDTFYLDGEPFRIISGSIHYFRTVPEYWRDRLEKLKAMGANTVETYIPWNMHEKKKGEFDFSGMLVPGSEQFSDEMIILPEHTTLPPEKRSLILFSQLLDLARRVCADP